MGDKIPEWSEEDYKGMARAVASKINLKGNIGDKWYPDRSENSIMVELEWCYKEKFDSRYCSYEGRISIGLYEGSMTKGIIDVLTCSEDDLLLYIANEYPWVSAIAAWRLENGR